MPVISVIMGVYNCQHIDALYSSVRSIIKQTYEDWEFIICDDGSTDKTADVLREIEKLDKRIRIIGYKKNKGLANALNYCLKYASGKYIARMDDDDISHKDRFEKQIKFLESHNEYDFVGSTANVFNKQGIWGMLKIPEYPQVKDFLWNIPFIHPSMIFRKDVLKNIGGYNTEPINRRCEDYTLVMELYSKGFAGYNIQEPLLDYYLENGSKKYRPMRDRIAEAKVRYIGYKKNHILCKGIPFIIKPILIGFIPQFIFKQIKIWQYRKK